jgi:hypothetical protein
MESCVNTASTLMRAPAAACGMFGSYDGRLSNDCAEPIVCRACWWSPVANAYADCVPIGQLPTNATVPVGVTHCEDAMLPDPPFRVRCIDEPSFEGPNDCLGEGPL